MVAMADQGDVATCTDAEQRVLLEMAGKLKTQANDAVKQGDFDSARSLYEEALQVLTGADDFDPECTDLELSLQRNRHSS